MSLTMWKEGMDLEAKYVRKKDLVKCLPASVLGGRKKRKNPNAVTEGGKRARMNTTDEGSGSGSLLAESDVSMNSFSTSQDSSTLLEDSITEVENGSPVATTAPPVRTGEVLTV